MNEADQRILDQITRFGDGPDYTYVIPPSEAVTWWNYRHPDEPIDQRLLTAELDELIQTESE